ncbi:hypothetical protein MP638_004426, partial [Amoeboaphelidium occidentale]
MVGVLSRYMSCPKEHHWKYLKRVLRYLKHTTSNKIVYGSKLHKLHGFADASYASDTDDRKSIGAYVFMSNGGAVSWVSKKQGTVAKSTTEAEYMALSQATSEAIWFRQLMMELKIDQNPQVIIYGDNQGALKLSKNPQFHNRTKHIDIAYHFIRERIELGEIDVKFKPTNEMVA